MLFLAAQALREKADDPAFQAQWREMKATAKAAAMAKISAVTGVRLPVNAMLDVQVGCVDVYSWCIASSRLHPTAHVPTWRGTLLQTLLLDLCLLRVRLMAKDAARSGREATGGVLPRQMMGSQNL